MDAEDDISVALAAAISAQSGEIGVEAEVSNDVYDVQVVRRGNSLWFGPVTSIGGEPVGLEVVNPAAADSNLGKAVRRILRAEQFAKTMDTLDTGDSIANSAPVELKIGLFESNVSELMAPGRRLDIGAECGPVGRAALQARGDDGFISIERSRDFKQCDVLKFSAKGKRVGQRDVNRIHIDAQYCVHVDYELIEGSETSRNVGSMMQLCSDCPGDVYSAGHERLYFLVSELEENGEALNLEGLLENCAGENRSARAAAARSLLETASRTGATRGGMSLLAENSSEPAVWVESYRWRVVPRAEVFREAGLME